MNNATAGNRWLLTALLGGVVVVGCERESSQTVGPTDEPTTVTEVPAEIQPTKVTTVTEQPLPEVPPAIAVAVSSADRPAADVARDADRRPAEVLAYFGVEPGDTILELVAGGGYFTEILSRVVGDAGHVFATRLAPERIAGGRLPNVTAVDDTSWGLAPGSVDLAFTALNYHDLINLKVDRAALLASVLTVLKPGGTFAVIDHAAAADSGTRDVGTLHRVDEAVVVDEITAAGFELIDTSALLRNRDDDHTLPVFDPAIRGKTDQFILNFRKPAAT
jgi:predicted methyltransferase